MPVVNIKGHGLVNFPDDMPADAIREAILQKFPSQFTSEHPNLTAYLEKVASGGFLKENIERFDTALASARGEAFEGKAPTTDENLLDFFGAGAMTSKVKPFQQTKAQYNKTAPLKDTEYLWQDIGGGKKIEIVQNPSSPEIGDMINEVKKSHPDLRGGDIKLRSTQDADGNKYYWNAFDAVHHQIEPKLMKRLGVELNQNNPKISHRKIVGEALMAGENVPESVLIDYPDLVDFMKTR